MRPQYVQVWVVNVCLHPVQREIKENDNNAGGSQSHLKWPKQMFSYGVGMEEVLTIMKPCKKHL